MSLVSDQTNPVTAFVKSTSSGTPYGSAISLGAIVLAILSTSMHLLPKLAPLLNQPAPAPLVQPYVPGPTPSTPAKPFDVRCPYCGNLYRVLPSVNGDLPADRATSTGGTTK